jgi:DNA excision repair protein ERCC-1
MAKAPANRLQTLPGFGQVKVKKMKEAFERPFRNQATSTLQATTSSFVANDGMGDGQGGGVERAFSEPEPSMVARTRAPRQPSPVWDIELHLDLDVNTHLSPESGPPPTSRADTNLCGISATKEPSSPVWDIELDLNGSDEDGSVTVNDKFQVLGAPALL